MDQVYCEFEYISASCNRYSHCVDWGKQLICFASKHSIAIYHVEKFKIVNLLVGHEGQVNCVKWINNNIENDQLLVSCSNDTNVLIWQRNSNYDFDVKLKLIGHSESVTVVDAVKTDDKILVVSSSNDKTSCIWENDKQIAKISFDNFIFDTKIISNSIFSNILIAFGGADEVITLYQLNHLNQVDLLIKLKGHEDWIRSIDITFQNDHLILASSSQDCFIRIYKIEPTEKDSFEINEKFFTVNKDGNQMKYLVTLETVLAGHENWVNQICWTKNSNKTLNLLSASMDKTLILWEQPNDENDLWSERVRVGEVGGNALGFIGCSMSFDGKSIVGHSFNGALHLWKDLGNQWVSTTSITGHFDQVTDISWEPNGQYLLSSSLDQTTRLHSIWNANSSWHEIARPQIHGYELNCISMINGLTFVCGADEKVLRIFKATKCFVDSLKMISDLDLQYNEKELAHSATVPSLGLSNRAIFQPNQIEHSFKPAILNEPPSEEVLLQNTLWPEIQKLYGHGYELFAVAANHSGKLIASACKASKSEHANVILWNVNDGKQIGKLHSHQLTITQIRFSYDDKYILTVSRDRTWALFELNQDNKYERVAFSDKKNGIHTRIIWDCSWSYDNKHFMTVSRDKTAVIWSIDKLNQNEVKQNSLGPVVPVDQVTLIDSIMSVDFATLPLYDSLLVAFGFENGYLHLYKWNLDSKWVFLHQINCHHLSIKKIRFSPRKFNANEFHLATCGNDNIVKILRLIFKKT